MSVSIQNLTKIYGTQQAVKDLTFTIDAGEILGFLGPNGAGKSTTMKMIAGYLKPSSGQILIDDLLLDVNQTPLKRKIGYLPENNPLYTDMYVREYLKYMGELSGVEKKVTERVEEVIHWVGLEREKHKKIKQLSKGYRQRVGLAQAIIHNPEILILDEPTTGLDPNQLVEIRSLIKNLSKDKTIILSTHIMQEVEAICDRVIIIKQGQLVADESLAAFKKRGQNLEKTFRQLTN